MAIRNEKVWIGRKEVHGALANSMTTIVEIPTRAETCIARAAIASINAPTSGGTDCLAQ